MSGDGDRERGRGGGGGGGGSGGGGRCETWLLACAGACCTGRAAAPSRSSDGHTCSPACTVWNMKGCAALTGVPGTPACTVCEANCGTAAGGAGVISGVRPVPRGAAACMKAPLWPLAAAGEGCTNAWVALAWSAPPGGGERAGCGRGGVTGRGCGSGGGAPRRATAGRGPVSSCWGGSPCAAAMAAPRADIGLCMLLPKDAPLRAWESLLKRKQ